LFSFVPHFAQLPSLQRDSRINLLGPTLQVTLTLIGVHYVNRYVAAWNTSFMKGSRTRYSSSSLLKRRKRAESPQATSQQMDLGAADLFMAYPDLDIERDASELTMLLSGQKSPTDAFVFVAMPVE
jgi:hypothetical protein